MKNLFLLGFPSEMTGVVTG